VKNHQRALPAMQHQRAFTLIELLIAMTIFAVLAVISYHSLDSLFKTREHLTVQSNNLRDLALLFVRLENDFAAIIDRPVRNADNQKESALRLSPLRPTENDASLVFTRGGFGGAAGASGGPKRIGYRLREGTLELLMWPSLDMAPRVLPQVHAALANVRDMQWRAMDRAGNYVAEWQSTGAENVTYFPAALELSITLSSGVQYTRLFTLAAGR
jgi:general secretion pathway protein J